MSDANDSKVIDRIIKLVLLVLLVGMSLLILAPFMMILIWGIIIAVGLFQLYNKSLKVFSNKKSLTATLFTLVGLAVIILPSIFLTTSSATEFQNYRELYNAGELTLPAPTEDVKEWPVIGEKLYDSWHLASQNLKEFLSKYRDQIGKFAGWFLNIVKSLGLTILQFIVSIIIAGVLLFNSQSGGDTTEKFASRLVGEKAHDFVLLTVGTIRSVVQGILGIAFIQALATALLMVIFDVPVPGLWALLVLIFAILQLPPLLVLGPIMLYVFSEYETVPASIFTVLAVIVSISDSFLKPIFLGRGVDIPMLVVLLGAIGGMLAFGILGLFVGAVVLALSYKLMMAWLEEKA